MQNATFKPFARCRLLKTVQFYKICVCTLVTQNAYFIDLYFIL